MTHFPRPSGRLLPLLAALIIIVRGIACPAQSTVRAPTEAQQRRIVFLVTPLQLKRVPAVQDTIVRQLWGLNVIFSMDVRGSDVQPQSRLAMAAQEMAQEGSADAVIWLADDSPGKLFLLIAGQGEYTRFDRDLQLDVHSSVQSENLAHIVRTVAQTLIERSTVQAVQPVEESGEITKIKASSSNDRAIVANSPLTDEAIAGQEQSAPHSPPDFFGLNTAYEWRSFSSEIPVVHGFWAGLYLRPLKRIALFAGYTVLQRIEAEGTCVRLSVTSHPITIGTRVLWQVERVSLGFSLSATFDPVTHTTSSRCAQIVPEPPKTRLNWAIGPGIYGSLALVPRVHLFMRLGMQFQGESRRYRAAADRQSDELLLEPWLLQPMAWLGMVTDLF